MPTLLGLASLAPIVNCEVARFFTLGGVCLSCSIAILIVPLLFSHYQRICLQCFEFVNSDGTTLNQISA